MNDEIIVRVMTRGEIDLALEWAAGEGWNPGLHDAASFPGNFGILLVCRVHLWVAFAIHKVDA